VSGQPLDLASVADGDVREGVDPATLIAGRPFLVGSRLRLQQQVRQAKTKRYTPITITMEGIVYDGNHAVRVALDEGESVDVAIIQKPAKGFGSIADLPIA
jgi:hypothetical protein